MALVRRGESQAAVEGVVAGLRGDVGLSQRGRVQVAALRDRLARTGELTADTLLASNLPRAVETAEIIAPALAAVAIVQDADLRELLPGECDGLTWDEYDERYGWTCTPTRSPPSPRESLVEFNLRVDRVLTRLAHEHEGRSLVVACHGGIAVGSLLALASAGP